MRVVVVAEFYPRAADPVLGVWAHRQALAARDAGADVRVVVLYRVVPSLASLRRGPRAVAAELSAIARQPRRERRDGLQVDYVRYASPPRGRSYASWGAWSARALARRLRVLSVDGPIDLIHAHNAVPAGDAVLRAGVRVPVVVSVHGGDVLYTAARLRGGQRAVARVLGTAHLVLANSAGIAALSRHRGARRTRVVHLGADLPARVSAPSQPPRIVTLGHLVARKRHDQVIRAVAALQGSHPNLRYEIVGDGPQRPALKRLAQDLGVDDRVTLLGQLKPSHAATAIAGATAMVMPSVDEAFGVAYVEAMAAGVPAVGLRSEPGPKEIAAAGEGMLLVGDADTDDLARTIGALISDPAARQRLGAGARETVAGSFTWARCGAETVAAYEEALP